MRQETLSFNTPGKNEVELQKEIKWLEEIRPGSFVTHSVLPDDKMRKAKNKLP